MNIQTSRLPSALATPASAGPSRWAAASVAATPVLNAPTRSDTFTLSQAAHELMAQSPAGMTLSSRAMDLIQRRNPFDAAPSTGNQQAQVRRVMDNLTSQHNDHQISSIQYQRDMAFYSRVSSAMG